MRAKRDGMREREEDGGSDDDETRAKTMTTEAEANAAEANAAAGDDAGAAPAYAEWYAAAMAAGGVVPATATPLPVPVVVPYNLVPGTRGDEYAVGGPPAPAPMMMYPPAPMMPAGDAAYAQMMAMQRECYATAMYNAQCYGYAAPTYAGDAYYSGGGGGRSGNPSSRYGRR